jgi:hypothetical protein
MGRTRLALFFLALGGLGACADSATPPPGLGVFAIEPADGVTGVPSDPVLAVRVEHDGQLEREHSQWLHDNVSVVAWPEGNPIPITASISADLTGSVGIVLSPTAPLEPGWYATCFAVPSGATVYDGQRFAVTMDRAEARFRVGSHPYLVEVRYCSRLRDAGFDLFAIFSEEVVTPPGAYGPIDVEQLGVRPCTDESFDPSHARFVCPIFDPSEPFTLFPTEGVTSTAGNALTNGWDSSEDAAPITLYPEDMGH